MILATAIITSGKISKHLFLQIILQSGPIYNFGIPFSPNQKVEYSPKYTGVSGSLETYILLFSRS